MNNNPGGSKKKRSVVVAIVRDSDVHKGRGFVTASSSPRRATLTMVLDHVV